MIRVCVVAGVAASFMLAAAFGALWYATRADLAAPRENVVRLEAICPASVAP